MMSRGSHPRAMSIRVIRRIGPARPTGGARRRGSILVIVLWVALGLVSLALYFGHTMMLENRAAQNAAADAQAAQAVDGAARYVLHVLSNLEEPGFAPPTDAYESEEMEIGDARVWFLGRPDDASAQKDEPSFGLVDEASKLNVNAAGREALEALPGMTAELAGSIIDWRDADEDVSETGAESQSYLLRDPACNCKNGSLESVEELRLLIGADMDVLLGEDSNLNGFLDPNENDGADTPPDDDSNGALDPGILEYLTVWSREPNRRADGSARVNVRTASQEELAQALAEGLDAQRAAQIAAMQGRENLRSLLEFYIRSQMTAEECARVEDALTVSDGAYTTGLVNVNTAPEAVLACLPGIGEDYASQIVAWREGKTDELKTVFWITNVLPQAQAIEAGRFVTTRSYQFSADIAAVGFNGRGFRRAFFVFDASGETPVIVYRRDRTRLGWPLGATIRKTLASAAAMP